MFKVLIVYKEKKACKICSFKLATQCLINALWYSEYHLRNSVISLWYFEYHLRNLVSCVKESDRESENQLASCKPRHWNLGIGIGIGTGIGTDITNVLFPVS